MCEPFSMLMSTDSFVRIFMHCFQCIFFFTRKKSKDSSKATFVFNGHLSVLLTPRMVVQWITFNAFFGPFNRPNKRRLPLTSNLPHSDFTQIILSRPKLLYYIMCLCVSISLYFFNKKECCIQYMNISVPDRRSRSLEVIVRRLRTWVLEIWRWGGLGRGLRKGRSVYKQPETKVDRSCHI
jgi:hypothetical protein